MDELGILIGGKIDVSKTVSQINKDLQSITSQIKSLNLNIDTSKMTKDINKQMTKLEKTTKKSMDIDMGDMSKESREVTSAIKDIEKEYKGTAQSVVKNTDVIEDGVGGLEERFKNLVVTVKTAQNEMKRITLKEFDDKNGKRIRQDEVRTINKEGEAREKNLKKAISLINKQEKEAQEYQQEKLKALEYERSTRKAIDESIRAEKKKTDELDYQVQKAKELARYKKQDLERRFGTVLTPDQNKQLDDYINSMNRITKTTPNAKREIDKLNTSFKGVESQIKATGTKVNGFGANLKEALSRIPVWINQMVHIKPI